MSGMVSCVPKEGEKRGYRLRPNERCRPTSRAFMFFLVGAVPCMSARFPEEMKPTPYEYVLHTCGSIHS